MLQVQERLLNLQRASGRAIPSAEAAAAEPPHKEEAPSFEDELATLEEDLGLEELEAEPEVLEDEAAEPEKEVSIDEALEEEGEEAEPEVPDDEQIDELKFPGEGEEEEFEEDEEEVEEGPSLTPEEEFDEIISETVLEHDVLEGLEEEISPIEEQIEEEEVSPTIVAAGPARRSRAFLWILIALLAVTAALAGAWYFSGQKPAKPEKDILGNKNITLDQKKTKHFWRQNEKEGPLLVITGLAENANPASRSYIKLKGTLNDEQENVLRQRVIYCGNVLSDDELRVLSMEEINKRLMRRTGEKGANLNIEPGKSVEFMIVFNNTPDKLAGYSVEVVSSQSASPLK